MSEPAVANLSLARLVKIEQRIAGAEDTGLRARWEFGRDLLAARDGKGRFKPSGISTSEADCWIFALGEPPLVFIGVPTERLKRLVRSPLRVASQPHGSCPTRGALVAVSDVIGFGAADEVAA